MHYLIEYGTERGPEAFEIETYAAINGTPIFEGEQEDNAMNGQFGLLDSDLNAHTKPAGKGKSFATNRMRTFLKAMTGEAAIKTTVDHSKRKTELRTVEENGKKFRQKFELKKTQIPVGTDIRDACNKLYTHFASIPNRPPAKFSHGIRILKPRSQDATIAGLATALTSEYV